MIRDIRARFTRSKLPFLVLVVGLVLTALTSYFALDSVNLSANYRFDRLNTEINDTIELRMRAYENALTQIRGLFEVVPHINRQDFRNFTENMMLASQYPGIVGVGFVEKVAVKDLDQFQTKIRKEYQNPQLRFWPKNLTELKELSEPVYILRFFEPEAAAVNGRNMVGHEPLSETQRNQTLMRARDSGQIVLSKPLRLLFDKTEDLRDYFLTIPVYDSNAPSDTIAQRKKTNLGFITASFRAKELFGEVFNHERADLESRHHVTFEIADPTLAEVSPHLSLRNKVDGGSNVVFKHRNTDRWSKQRTFDDSEIHRMTPLKVGDRELQVRVYTLEGFNPLSSSLLPSLVVIFGTILSIVASYMLRLNDDQAIRIMKSERSMRLITDAVPVLISYVGRDGKFQFVNKNFEEWLKKPLDTFIGKRVQDIFGEKTYQLLRPYQERTYAGEAVSFDTEISLSSDFAVGRHRPVHVSYVPDYAEDGSVRGYVALTTDITARRKQEDKHRFLSDLTVLLNATLDVDEIMHRCASLIVPRLGDWCIISNIEATGKTRRTCATLGESRQLLVPQIETILPVHLRQPILTSIERGDPYLCTQVNRQWLESIATTPEELELFTKMEMASTMYLPLKARNRIIGTISIISSSPDRLYDNDDLLFAMDLSRRAALAIDNAQLYRESQLAGRAKDEFLATLSHELRTPMNVILGWLEILRAEELQGAEYDQALNTLSRNAQVQIQLINDLLDISRIVSGKITLRPQAVSLNEAAKTGLDSVTPAARVKSIELKSEIAAEDLIIMGDPDRLQQVIWNLLSNAVKFTPEKGSITIRTERTEQQDRLIVEDTGYGIDPRFLPYIFDRFQQEDGSTTRSQGGLGLGLSIVRSVVELHGGTIEAFSKGRDQGTKFVVSFPTSAANQGTGHGANRSRKTMRDETSQTADGLAIPVGLKTNGTASDSLESEKQANSPLSGVDILLVDDSKDVRDLISRLLSRRGASIRTAENAPDAFDIVLHDPPDILLSDIGLPNEDGLSLIRRIRSMEVQNGRARVPAAALTAYAQTSDSQQALAAGFDFHLAKPVRTEDLLAAVESLAKQGAREEPRLGSRLSPTL